MAKNFNAWPEGWPKSLNYPDIPVHAFLDQTAERVPNRIAIIFGGMELTYGELKELSERFATALAGMGVKKGDRVAIHLPNCPQFAVAYYGALKIGAVFTPLSPLLAPREARHQLNDSGAETLISLDLLYPGISNILPETGVKRVVTTSIADCYNAIIAPLKPLGKTEVPDTIDMASLLKEHEPDVPEVPIDVRRDLVHLAYTGGTTGLSKGVALTHFNVVANAFQFGHWFTGAEIEMIDGKITPIFPPGVDPERDRGMARDGETSLVVVPWFHAMGTVGYLNNQVLGGNTMVVFPRFEPREFLEAVVKYKATLLGGAPQLFIPLVSLPDFKSYDLSGIKMAGSGAAPLAMPVLDKMLDAFSGVVIEAYGLSECTMGATSNPPDRAEHTTRLGGASRVRYRVQGRGRGNGRGPSPRLGGRDLHQGAPGHAGVLEQAGRNRQRAQGRLAAYRRYRQGRRGRLLLHHGPEKGSDHLQGIQCLPAGDRGGDLRAPCRAAVRGRGEAGHRGRRGPGRLR